MVSVPFIITFLFLILLPENAFAWGPATHLELGWSILDRLSLLAPPLRDLIGRFPYDYLYGSISADIVVGKRFASKLKHCHNWKVGIKVLKRASSPSQKAFALGYLSHLAADTISHNHFIPERLIKSFSTNTLRHVYWELRFDSLVDRKYWNLAKMVEKRVHRDNDRLLKSILEETLLPFNTNKTIFSSILLIKRFNTWHRMIDKLSSRSKWVLSKEDKVKYSNLSVEAIIGLLTLWENAPCIKEDPTGRENLELAKGLRKRLKRVKRRDGDVNGLLDSALKAVSYQPLYSNHELDSLPPSGQPLLTLTAP